MSELLKGKTFQVLIIGSLLVIVGVRWLWTSMSNPYSSGKCKECNLILVSVDSLRVDRMGLYGYPRPTTPYLSAWAKSGIVFDNFYSTAYLTPVSEGSIHTGLYPENNGLISFKTRFAPQVRSLAERLKGAGYKTMAFGNSPEFYSFFSVRDSFNRGFDQYSIPSNRVRTVDWDSARKFLKENSGPKFLWMVVGSPHSPFGLYKNKFADEKYHGPFWGLIFGANLQLYYDGTLFPLTARTTFLMDPKVRIENGPMDQPTKAPLSAPVHIGEEDLKYIRDQYDNGVAEADQLFGELQDLISEAKMDNNTVVVFESEHGEDLGEHKYIAHYDLWETTVHEPLVIKSPAISQGTRIANLVSGVDVLPSLMDHLDIPVSEKLDGKSFFSGQGGHVHVEKIRDEVYLTRSPLWESVLKVKDTPNSLFDKFRELDDSAGFKDYAIRDSRYKLIHRRAREVEKQFSVWTYVSGHEIVHPEYELYDLQLEPSESAPISTNGDHEKTFLSMKEKLDQWEKGMAATAIKTRVEKTLQDYQ